MRSKSIIVVVLVLGVFNIGLQQAEAGTVYLDRNDGQIYNIDYDYEQGYDTYVMRVDYQSPEMFTTVNFLIGARLGGLVGYENSIINVSGGWINGLTAEGSSRLFMSGGSVGYSTNVWGNSEATIIGGGTARLFVSENGSANVSGGSYGQLASLMTGQIYMSNGSIGNIVAGQSATITLVGSGFAIDGQPVDFGSITSIHGNDYVYETVRHLTGTFLDGNTIDCDFRIGNGASIILTPEPATLLLLSLGALMLRKRC